MSVNRSGVFFPPSVKNYFALEKKDGSLNCHMHSLATSLGTSVHLFIHAVIQNVDRVTAVQCMKLCRRGTGASVHIHIKHQDGMVVSARRPV